MINKLKEHISYFIMYNRFKLATIFLNNKRTIGIGKLLLDKDVAKLILLEKTKDKYNLKEKKELMKID